MPASIAHMLISRAARIQIVNNKNKDIAKFGKKLEEHSNYMELGSLGPDLPYYANLVGGAMSLLLDRSDKPMGVDPWSYQLHSKDPNVFPLKYLEAIWRDSPEKDWDDQDRKKFAFICGFLSHIAADQIIHPKVNGVAGPYYKGGQNREVHRNCEVYQDVLLHRELERKDLLNMSPNEWCDLNSGYGKNTEDWFRYSIQKAFVEAHAVCPSEDDIESWVDGMLLTLRGLNNFGPYVKAARDTGKKKPTEYFYGINYMGKCYTDAVKLSVIYILAAYKLYNADEWDDSYRQKFMNVVRNADLSCPLEDNVLKSAEEAFKQW